MHSFGGTVSSLVLFTREGRGKVILEKEPCFKRKISDPSNKNCSIGIGREKYERKMPEACLSLG